MSEPTPVVSYARISSDLRGDEHGVQDQHKLNRETEVLFCPMAPWWRSHHGHAPSRLVFPSASTPSLEDFGARVADMLRSSSERVTLCSGVTVTPLGPPP
jgi:hypothetical protein